MVCSNATAKGSHSDRGCTTCNSCLLISDDAGKSWSIGAVGQQGTRESQIVQVKSQNQLSQGGIQQANTKDSTMPQADTTQFLKDLMVDSLTHVQCPKHSVDC